jgi:hypothetical protein
MAGKAPNCDFCGNARAGNPRFVMGNNATICYDCIVLCAAVVSLTNEGLPDGQFEIDFQKSKAELIANFPQGGASDSP